MREVYKKIKEKNIENILLGIVLIIELLLIVVFNFFHIGDAVDEDFSGMMRHTIEIARNKTLLLDNWFYPTSGEFDTSLLAASLLYIATQNIYISFAISNLISVSLLGYVTYRVLKLSNVKPTYILMALCMIFCFYDFGTLAYANMLFFGGAQYAIKVALPLLFIVILYDKREGIIAVFDSVLFYALFFLTSFSTGIYVYFIGIIPILMCALLIGICSGFTDRKRILLNAVLTALIAVVGLLLNKRYDLEMHSFNSNLMKLRHGVKFSEAFCNVIDTFVGAVNPITDELVDAVSFQGISGGIKWIMLALICFGLFYIPKTFAIAKLAKTELCEEEPNIGIRDGIITALISVFVWNFFILLITVSKSRYHLIGLLPLVLCAVMYFETLFKNSKKTELLFLSFFSGIYIVYSISVVVHYAPKYFNHEVSGVFYLDRNFAEQIASTAAENDVDTVIFVNEVEEAEMMRIYDMNVNYETYMSSKRQVYNYDYYITERDRSKLSNRNILAVADEEYEGLQEYIKNAYRNIGKIGNYNIMIADECPMDGGTLIIENMTTIDLPISPGYEYSGDIGTNGYLYSVDENVMESPEFTGNIDFIFAVNYERTGNTEDGAYIELFDRDNNLLEEKKIDATADSVSFECEKNIDYKFKITNLSGELITIKEIEFSGK